jgi:uncharacterized membrane protein YhfC
VSFRMGISDVGSGAIAFAVDALNEHTIHVSSLHGKDTIHMAINVPPVFGSVM